MALPSGVRYGQVSWQALSAVADGNDADGDPDSVPVSGTVTFSASSPLITVGGITEPITVFLTPVTYTLDARGALVDGQRRSLITLVATNTVPDVSWTWTASYRLDNGLTRGSFNFELPAGSVVDLTNPTVPLWNGSPIPPDPDSTTVVNNDDGSQTLTGPHVVDNGDGTFTVNDALDNGDGTYGLTYSSVVNYAKSTVDLLLSAKQDTASLDTDLAALIADGNSSTAAALGEGYVPTSSLVLSPTAPIAPAPGTVWINTSV